MVFPVVLVREGRNYRLCARQSLQSSERLLEVIEQGKMGYFMEVFSSLISCRSCGALEIAKEKLVLFPQHATIYSYLFVSLVSCKAMLPFGVL